MGRCAPSQTYSRASSTTPVRPDILECSSCTLYKFGDPTSEPAKALFRDLDWRIRDTSSSSSSSASSEASSAPEAWGIIGPRAVSLVDAALLGRARADPPSSRSWPFIGASKPVEQAVKKVSFSTRLESNSYLATSGEFTDYTARYYAIRADDEDAVTLRVHLEKHAKRTSKDEGKPLIVQRDLEKVTESLKLDHLLDIPLVALSNGQTRRARIAKALLSKPEVLILEGPFSKSRFLAGCPIANAWHSWSRQSISQDHCGLARLATYQENASHRARSETARPGPRLGRQNNRDGSEQSAASSLPRISKRLATQ